MRTICIGDIHGCLTLLERLLEKVKYDPAADHLVSVGDLIDRGPSPVGVVRLMRDLQRRGKVTVIRGNHDDKCAEWFQKEALFKEKGRKNNMRPPNPKRRAQWEELSPEDVAWLAKLPVLVKVLPDWYAVHAGFEDMPLNKQMDNHLMRVRWIDEVTGEHKGMDKESETPYEIPKGCIPWMERWKGPENVVYGHAVHSRKSPRVDRPVPGVETWGIDTGACFGGNLTALCLETREVFQVSDGVEHDRLYAVMRDGS